MKANCIVRHQPFCYFPLGKYHLSENLCVANQLESNSLVLQTLHYKKSDNLFRFLRRITQDCSKSWSTIIGAVATLSDEITILG